MKKLVNLLVSVVMGATLFGGFASADSCTIQGTGAGSNNSCSLTTSTNVTVTCDNNVWVGKVNTQNATSGSGTVQYNTSSGNVVSGQAVNTNSGTVTIGTGCNQATATQGTPGKGATELPSGGGGAAGAPAALPNTGDSSLLGSVLAGLAIASGVAIFSRLAVAVLRRRQLR